MLCRPELLVCICSVFIMRHFYGFFVSCATVAAVNKTDNIVDNVTEAGDVDITGVRAPSHQGRR